MLYYAQYTTTRVQEGSGYHNGFITSSTSNMLYYAQYTTTRVQEGSGYHNGFIPYQHSGDRSRGFQRKVPTVGLTTNSYIDVTLSTHSAASSITLWEVLDTQTLTEHQYILFEIKGLNTKRGRLANQRDEVDWEAFKSTIELTVGKEEHVNYEKGSKLIRQAYKNSIKPRGRRKRGLLNKPKSIIGRNYAASLTTIYGAVPIK
ncbi:hypothetical protein QE152_g39024 [Popillia japonica]|uniref:Uncharacterized protein n=1 Tax=Popillia japonica TaxID=7064 RepID=A0AAW1HV66_POPJA